jgi:hypothetical protein
VNIWFDLMMASDQDGKRFEHFRSNLPHGLAAGAHLTKNAPGMAQASSALAASRSIS